MKRKLILLVSLSLLLTACGTSKPNIDYAVSSESIEIQNESTADEVIIDTEVVDSSSEPEEENSTQIGSGILDGNNLYTSRPYSEFKEKKFDYSITSAKYSCNITVDEINFVFPDTLNDIYIINKLNLTKKDSIINESVNNIDFVFKGGSIFHIDNTNICINYYDEDGKIFLVVINNLSEEYNKVKLNGVKCGDKLDYLIDNMGEPTFIEIIEDKESYIYEDSQYSMIFEISNKIIDRILIYKK